MRSRSWPVNFASPVIWLLIVASALSAALGEWLDAIAIGAILIINAVIGFFREHRAERAVMRCAR